MFNSWSYFNILAKLIIIYLFCLKTDEKTSFFAVFINGSKPPTKNLRAGYNQFFFASWQTVLVTSATFSATVPLARTKKGGLNLDQHF